MSDSDGDVKSLEKGIASTQLESVDPATGETLITPDPEDFEITHPLQNKWTIWYTPPKKNTKSWTKAVKLVEVTTVEEFWGMFTAIGNGGLEVSQLQKGSDLSFFKSNVQPDWDDKTNQGRWVVGFTKQSRDISSVWHDGLLASIGETLSNTDAVCGIVVQCRGKANKISLWINSTDEDVYMALGKSWQAAIKWEHDLHYESFHVKPPVSCKLSPNST